jgi:hypothetical protein
VGEQWRKGRVELSRLPSSRAMNRLSCEAFKRRVDLRGLGGVWVVLRGFEEEALLGFWRCLLGHGVL